MQTETYWLALINLSLHVSEPAHSFVKLPMQEPPLPVLWHTPPVHVPV